MQLEAELAADMADDPKQSDNLQEIMENEFRTLPIETHHKRYDLDPSYTGTGSSRERTFTG